MFNTGIEIGWNMDDESQWIEYFQTPGKYNPSRKISVPTDQDFRDKL